MEISEIGLKSKAALLKEAKSIAAQHVGEGVVSAKECVLQGMFGHTVVVTMTKDGIEDVIQLCAESVDEKYAQQSYDILGDLVPVPVRVVRDGSPLPYACIMPRVSGLTYYTATLYRIL